MAPSGLYGFFGDTLGSGSQRFANDPSELEDATLAVLLDCGAVPGVCSGAAGACLAFGGGVGPDGIRSEGSYPK